MPNPFEPWVARVRKDPLGPHGFNSLLFGFRWDEDMFGQEHIHATGEHNAAEIPREVGSVYITAGPTGNKEGFRYATAATRSALGTIQLATDATQYTSIGQMALQVTNCSETGINKPCITQALVNSTSAVEFYSKYLTSALGAGNVWASEDANFCAAIMGAPKPVGVLATESVLAARGTTLKESAAAWNAHVAADQSMRSDFLVGHSTVGLHTNREVAQGWAYVVWDGATLRSSSGGRNSVTTTTRVSQGIYELTWGTAWTLSAQPFVALDYARTNGGLQGDIWICCCPRSFITTTKVRFYLYKYDTVNRWWNRDDTDLFCVVHAG